MRIHSKLLIDGDRAFAEEQDDLPLRLFYINHAFLCILNGCVTTWTLQLSCESDGEDKKKPLIRVSYLFLLIRYSLYFQRKNIIWLFASCAFVLVPFLVLHLIENLWPLPFLCYLLCFAFFMHCALLCTSLTTSLQIHLLRPCSQCSALFSKPLDPRLLSWPRAGSTGKVYEITTLKSVSCCLRIRWIPQFFIIPWDGPRLTWKWFESYRTSCSAPCQIYLS